MHPALPMAHFLLGQIRLAQLQLPAAVAEFEHERDLNPLFGEVYERLGDCYVRQGDYLSRDPSPWTRAAYIRRTMAKARDWAVR